jgi:zinc/manganese transport system substrate-binding protein
LFVQRRTLLWLGVAQAVASTALAQNAAPPRIVASFSLLADIVRELAPAGSDVTALVGADSDAHVFEPRPADGRRLAQADLVVINGLGFEGWIERLVKGSGYGGTVVVAAQGITPRRQKLSIDPHLWQDLRLMRQVVTTLSAAMQQRWPEHRATLEQRRDAYLAKMQAVDAQIRQWLEAVPRVQRRVITSHDAFGYFGAAYGVDFVAPQGWNTHSEPSAAAVGRLIRQIKAEGIRAVFVENISDKRLVERIANESGAALGGTLFSDALSRPEGLAPTYLALMTHNARTIATALMGAALK